MDPMKQETEQLSKMVSIWMENLDCTPWSPLIPAWCEHQREGQAGGDLMVQDGARKSGSGLQDITKTQRV